MYRRGQEKQKQKKRVKKKVLVDLRMTKKWPVTLLLVELQEREEGRN